MAIRNIIKEGDPFLNKISHPVEKFDKKLADLLDDMQETMHEADGVGLAAPQVGILRRAVVIDIGEGPLELINPVFLEQSGEQECLEGCLSSPGQYGITKRPMHVKVRAQNRKGEFFEMEGEQLLATVSCHEIDHLDGILFKSHVIHMLDEEELANLK
ncbi:peptide deformylase [Caproiciproducens galactitolivorans]|uniref:Peptide deformylase n=1 Tax=Caproiciproducens galactitolivorans TaxID=642589 RepID=A0ABT4BVE3_9FIRM|nr:peptide deformylase [Caproiciproducens galactitolivorans]MCY1714310.1 peptide deformylase [Caproiciproducens galactitolivorans]